MCETSRCQMVDESFFLRLLYERSNKVQQDFVHPGKVDRVLVKQHPLQYSICQRVREPPLGDLSWFSERDEGGLSNIGVSTLSAWGKKSAGHQY